MPQPNIILINCDDLGYGDLGCYGSGLHDTPVLDQMAKEGIRFTDFYMASSVCSPSRAAMLTGCYPQRVGLPRVLGPGDAIGLHPQEITFPKLLQQAGYATQLVGKWHCGDQPPFLPTRHGFDGYYGLPYSNDMGRNRDNYGGTPPLPLMLNEGIIQQQPDQVSLTERYVEQSVRFIRENQDRPFFLYMTHMYVHVPLYVPDRFMRGSRNGLYGGAVSCIDWATEVILYELKALGLDEQTLVIFTSDNGARWTAKGGNDPLRGWKSTTWEGGFRLPCIMRWPGHIPAGSVCRVMITAMDFYPTLATIGGAEIPGDRIIDGQDIRYLIFSGGQGESPHDAFFYYKHGRIEAVRSGKWKLHVGKSEVGAGYKPMQKLYDLEADPGESEDRYAAKPDVVAALMAKVEACRQDLGDETTGTIGKNVREPGRVENPQPMTAYDVNHPYIIEEYDLKDERV